MKYFSVKDGKIVEEKLSKDDMKAEGEEIFEFDGNEKDLSDMRELVVHEGKIKRFLAKPVVGEGEVGYA